MIVHQDGRFGPILMRFICFLLPSPMHTVSVSRKQATNLHYLLSGFPHSHVVPVIVCICLEQKERERETGAFKQEVAQIL